MLVVFSSTGKRPGSYCHGLVSVVPPSICRSVGKLCLQKTSPPKLLTGFLPNFTGMFLRSGCPASLKFLIFFNLTKIPKKMKNPKGIPKNALIISHEFLFFFFFFLAHLSTECSVSYCDHSLSVCPSNVRPQFSR